MSLRIRCFLFFSLIILLRAALAQVPPRAVPHTITRTTTRADPRLQPPTVALDTSEPDMVEYVRFYKAQTEPLNLWNPDPLFVALHNMPHNVDPRETLLYLDALENDNAYIHPRKHPWLRITKLKMKFMIRPDVIVTVHDQRSFLALYEDVSRHSAFRIQTALHPANVQAQHKPALEHHRVYLTDLIDAVDHEAWRTKLTRDLDDFQGLRFFRAHQVLAAEIVLLKQAELFATKLPHLGI